MKRGIEWVNPEHQNPEPNAWNRMYDIWRQDRFGNTLVALLLLAMFGLPFYINFKDREFEEERVKTFLSGSKLADAEVHSKFKVWHHTTYANGHVLDWSGKDATLIWMQRLNNPVEREGSYVFWAMTPTKKYFWVIFYLDRNGQFTSKPRFDELYEKTVVRALIDSGQSDLISKMGLLRSPA